MSPCMSERAHIITESGALIRHAVERKGRIMASTVEFLSPQDIERRRRELVEEAGMDVEALRDRLQRGLLDTEAQGLLDELEDLEYLSGE